MFETLKKHRIDPEVEHELAVIDLAVRSGETSRPEDAELTDFAMKLRGARTLPDAGEIARLDARVTESCADDASASPRKQRRNPRKLALAVAGACFVVALVGVSASTLTGQRGLSFTQGEDDSGSSSNALGVSEGGSEDQAVSESAGAKMAPESAKQGARVQTLSSDLLLVVQNSEIADASDGVIAATDRYGGYVSRSNTDLGESRSRASLDLMIPAVDYEAALAAISSLGHVKARSQSTEDITAPYRRAESSLDRAIKQRDRLSRQRRAATTDAERDALTIRLRSAIRRVAAERQQLSALERQASYVAMHVSILGDDSVANSSESTIEAAWRVAQDLLEKIVAALILVIAVLLPFALLGAVGFGAMRLLRRRRSDALIDAAAAEDRP